jgi:hypothetical protein
MSSSTESKTRKSANKTESKKKTKSDKAKPKREVSEKTRAEQIKHDLAIDELANLEYIINDTESTNKAFYEKFSNKFYLMILEQIDNLKKNEKVNSERYPESKYILLQEKLNPVRSTKRVSKTETSKTKRAPKKKGQIRPNDAHTVDDESNDSESASVISEDHEANGKNGNQDMTSSETTSSNPTDETEQQERQPEQQERQPEQQERQPEQQPADKTKKAKKPPGKKNVSQIGKKGKVMLAFIVNRFIYEIYSNEDDSKKRPTLDQFRDFVLNIKNFPAQLSRSIMLATLRPDSNNISCVDSELKNLILSAFPSDMNNSELKNVALNVLLNYFKILAKRLSALIWSSRRVIDNTLIESVMKMLDDDNRTYESKYYREDKDNLHDALFQGELMVKKLCPTTTKAKKSKKNSKSEVEEASVEEASVDEDKKSKKKKPNTKKSKAKKDSDEEEEEEEEEEASADEYESEEEEEEASADEDDALDYSNKKKVKLIGAK